MNLISGGPSGLVYEYPSHTHGHWEAALYIKGKGDVYCGSRRIAIEPGLLVCNPPGLAHREVGPEGYANQVVSFRRCSLPTGVPAVMVDPAHKPFRQLMDLTIKEYLLKRPGWEHICDRYLDTLLSYLMPRTETAVKHASVEKLEHLLLDNLANAAFRVHDALEGFDVSPYHFSRLFKKQTGLPPLQYLLDRRVEAARHLLRSTGMPVQNVAVQTGFDDPYYFSRLFKKRTGMSPRRFRNSGVE